MNIKKRFFAAICFLVFGNFFIASCAVVMFIYTCSVFSLKVPELFFPFIFFAALTSYSLHWYLTNHINVVSLRLNWTLTHKKLILIFFVFSFIGTVVLFVFLLGYYKLLLPLAFITFMYTAPKIPVQPFIFLRKIAVLKTTYLALVWVFITAVLPVLIPGYRWETQNTLFALNRTFLIFPICVLFDYRDREDDFRDGIRNIATLVNSRGLDIVFWTCLLLNIISAVLLHGIMHNAVITVCNIIPSVLLALTYKISKTTKSDLWFYLYLDGLMMLSGLVYIILFLS